ncbi:MAG: hypothetical protein AAFP19_17745, partial [Bacteroidota bacterium]
MASTIPFSILPGQEEFILNYLNNIADASEITDNKQLKDDPQYDGAGGYTIGDKVATNLINAKSKLPRGQFRTLDQVLEVKGMGHDKLRDLMTSFWTSADEAFHRQLFSGLLHHR